MLGQGLPLVVALFAIPHLVAGLGTARFGVLTLAWVAIGYFSLFDLGLGRALTRQVAALLGAGERARIPPAASTGLAMMLAFGIVGALAALAVSPWLAQTGLKIPNELKGETLASFYILSATIPFVIVTSGLRGVLEAYQRFGAVNLIRTVFGVFNFLGPLLVLPFSSSLVPIVTLLAGSRMVGLIIHFALSLRVVPELGSGRLLDKRLIRPLLNVGGWMTVSNVVGPLMVYLDRFLIGALLSMTAVAYYVTPYEVVTKLWLVPGALASALFPAFAATIGVERQQTARLFQLGSKALFVALFPVILIILTYAREGLELWLGSEFADNSAAVLKWLAVGVFLNSMAQLPFSLIQGAGRADITAKLHLAELPGYLLLLWALAHYFGITGVAMAWVLRVSVDTALLFGMARQVLPEAYRGLRKEFVIGLISAALLAGASQPIDQEIKPVFVMLSISFFLVAMWRLGLASVERKALVDFFAAKLFRKGEL